MTNNILERSLNRRTLVVGSAAAIGAAAFPRIVEAQDVKRNDETSLSAILVPEDEIGKNTPKIVGMRYVQGEDGVDSLIALRTDRRILRSDYRAGEYTEFELVSNQPVSESLQRFKKLGFAVADSGKAILVPAEVSPSEDQGNTGDQEVALRPALFFSQDGGETFRTVDEVPPDVQVFESYVIPGERELFLLHELGPSGHTYSFLDPKTGEYRSLKGNNDTTNVTFIRDVFQSPEDDDRIFVVGPAPASNTSEKETRGWRITEIDLNSEEIVSARMYATDREGTDDVTIDPVTGLLYVSHAEDGKIFQYKMDDSGWFNEQAEISYNDFWREDLEKLGQNATAYLVDIRVHNNRIWGAGRYVAEAENGDPIKRPFIATIEMDDDGKSTWYAWNMGNVAEQIQFATFRDDETLPRVTALLQGSDDDPGLGPVSFPTDEDFKPIDEPIEYPSIGLES